jgi:PAS domain S-box-containing protein
MKPTTIQPVSPPLGLDEVVKSFPAVLETLRTSYATLEARARRVEEELCSANRELERKVRELDGLKRHLEAVLESLPCGVIERDGRGFIVRANRASQAILGLSSRTLVGQQCVAGLQGEQADGRPHELVRADASRRVLCASYAAVRGADGGLAGSVEILADRTETQHLSERLHASDKMAALGTLAAGIAHEIRNPLNAVKGFAALLSKQRYSDARFARWAQRIVQGVGEADLIIENMLSFGSPERLRLAAIDAGALAEQALRLARHADDGLERTDSRWRFHVDTAAPPFLGDQIKLRQALRNLVANAVDAQPRGGVVALSIVHEGEHVVVRVRDAGPGVPADARARIFDPFFTTRADGTGLGLALVATIAKLHGGSVEVRSERSELGGAEFVLRFPFQPAPGSVPLRPSP